MAEHRQFCYLLINRYPNINLRDILNIPYLIQDLIPQYADYLELEEKEVLQIFECLTVTPENIQYHLKEHKSFSPTFIKVSNTHVMRSVYGCLNKPILFLNNELKRRFPKDYHNNTNREKIFREQLYDLLKNKPAYKNRLVTINREVNINSGDIRTDIDAAIYDRKTKNLGLFQLKWQELFAHDLKDRRNRLTNFSQKAEEWVEKMRRWTSTTNSKEILSSLTILDKVVDGKAEINQVYLFVINRYNSSFTGFTPSDVAAWASWYHVLEVSHKIATNFNDPIKELYYKIKIDSPLNKSMGFELEEFELECKTFRILLQKYLHK